MGVLGVSSGVNDWTRLVVSDHNPLAHGCAEIVDSQMLEVLELL